MVLYSNDKTYNFNWIHMAYYESFTRPVSTHQECNVFDYGKVHAVYNTTKSHTGTTDCFYFISF